MSDLKTLARDMLREQIGDAATDYIEKLEAENAALILAIQATEARMAEAVEAERERTSWGVMCGDNPSQIPADMVGCGKPIMGPSQTYRCTHCDVPFHKACAEKHFQSDNVLTEEMVDEIERREAIRSRSNAQD